MDSYCLVVVVLKALHALPIAVPIAILATMVALALLNAIIPSTSQPSDEEYFTVTTTVISVITETQVLTTTATATTTETKTIATEVTIPTTKTITETMPTTATTTVAMPTTETRTIPTTVAMEVVPTWAWGIIGVLAAAAAALTALFVRKK